MEYSGMTHNFSTRVSMLEMHEQTKFSDI